MRFLSQFLLASILLTVPGGSHAVWALTEIREEPAEPAIELIVIEARGCPMCQLFRDEIAPRYRATARSKRAPLRFLDVAHTDPDTLKLNSPIQIVPTIVLMREGAEIDRLVGYTAPELFMRAVGVMLGETP